MKLIDKLVNKLIEALDKWLVKHADWGWEEGRAQAEDAGDDAHAPQERRDGGAAPEPLEALVWKYGGVDGSRATVDPKVVIGNLSSSRSGMRYVWVEGSLKQWGLADGDAEALACAFYRDGETWVGGKFDWISTSRRARDYKNVEARYHGWEPEKFFAAKEHGFLILSKDGKKSSNFISCKV